MPNWCYNNLTVTGPKDIINKFHLENKTDSEELSFNKSVPMPENIEEMSDVEFKSLFKDLDDFGKLLFDGSCRWYSFNVIKWGTKWEVSDVNFDENNLSENEKELSYSFDTAWSPPVEWLKRVSLKYPDLNFELIAEEYGMDFYVNLKLKNGNLNIIEETTITGKNYKLIKKLDLFYEKINMFIEELDLKNKNKDFEFEFSDMECYDNIFDYIIHNVEDGFDEMAIESYFKKLYDSMEILTNFFNKIKKIKLLNKITHFYKFSKVKNELIDFHLLPPCKDIKLLKNGGAIFQNAKERFYNKINV